MYSIAVNGMSCGHCARALTKAIQQYDPEADVQIDLAQKCVTVMGELSEPQLRAAIIAAGFEPGLMRQTGAP